MIYRSLFCAAFALGGLNFVETNRYSLRWLWPVGSRAINTTCFRCCKAPYRVGPVVVLGCWLIFRRRFAFSLPVFHSVPIWFLPWIELGRFHSCGGRGGT